MKKLIISLSLSLMVGQAALSPVYADHNRTFFTNENIGRIFGTGLGAFVGSKVGKGRGNDIAIAAGAVGGYVLGGKVGRDWRSGHHNQSSGHRSSASGSGKGYLYPVQAMPELEHIDAIYQANRTSNVRGGPSTRYVVVDGLQTGEQVRVLGRVRDKNWYMVAQDDIIQGFVHMSLLEPEKQYISYNDN
jgi:uncharacterized protein YcfJ